MKRRRALVYTRRWPKGSLSFAGGSGTLVHVPAAGADVNTDGVHLFLYDGVCGLCGRLLQFVLPRDRGHVFHFASLQSPTGRAIVQRAGRNPDELTTLYVVANYRTPGSRLLTKGRAGLFVASAIGWPWKAALLFRVLPAFILDWAYDIVARNRYQLFGRTEQCLVPRTEDRQRFVDF